MKTRYKNNSILKYITILFSLFVLMNFWGCKDEACEYDTDICNFNQTNSELSGWTVATCHSRAAGNAIGVIYDTRLNSTAPPGDDWGINGLNTPTLTIHPTSWTQGNLGQIFGIAIDDNENIYLAASHIYDQSGTISLRNSVPGQVYKSSGHPTWNTVPLFTVPNTGGNLNGTGNIAYDKKNDQLFVTNLEDGKIYRYHISTASIDSFDPWAAYPTSNPAGIVAQDERVWGIGVNYEGGNVKVYFPRITSAGAREIYSITLNSDGSFPTGVNPEVSEINGISGTQLSISDIAFSSNTNEMLISERGNPHEAKVISYTRIGNTWGFNKQYFVGGNAGIDGENSAGGVDFAYKERSGNINEVCDDFFWTSGNYMFARNYVGLIYGLEGISYAGNLSSSTIPITNANQSTDIFIDLDPRGNDKGGLGDVEVFDANKCFDICSQ